MRIAGFLAVLCAATTASAQEAPAPKPPATTVEEFVAKEAAKEDAKKDEGRKDEARPFVQVDEIVVSAERGAPLGWAGGRDVIEKDVIEEYPSMNLSDIVRRVPGVYVIPEAGNDGRVNIGLRGNDPRRSGQITILVDGIPIAEGPYGQQDVDALPVSMERVFRVDVIRGGASTRYGPNSAGGVINLVTDPIPDKPTARTFFRYGSNADIGAVTAVGGTYGKFGFLLTGVEKSGDGYRDNSDYGIHDGSAKLRWAFNDRDVVSFTLSRYVEDSSMPGGLTQADYDEDPEQSTRPDGRMRADQTTYHLGFVHDAGPRSSFEVVAWYKNLDRTLTDVRPVLAPYTSHRVQDTYSNAGAAEARYTCPLDIEGLETDVFVSGRFLMERVVDWFYSQPFGAPKAYPSILNATFTGSSTALFLEDTAHLSKVVDLALGGRAEHLTMDSVGRESGVQQVQSWDLVLPEGSLTWRVQPKTSLYASYQRSFGPPQYETGFDPSSSYYTRVKPEYADLYEIGARSREMRGLEATAAVFLTNFEDRLEYVNTSGGNKVPYNVGKEVHKGIELGASWELGAASESLRGFSVYATGTFMRNTIESGPYEGNRSPNSPERLASWGARYEHKSGFFARIGGSYSGDAYKEKENFETGSANGVSGPIPAATLWDAGIGWRQDPDGEGFTVQVGVTNLFEEEYYRRFSTGIYPGAPRQVFASVGYAIGF